jgi:hypothetical protein
MVTAESRTADSRLWFLYFKHWAALDAMRCVLHAGLGLICCATQLHFGSILAQVTSLYSTVPVHCFSIPICTVFVLLLVFGTM